jgi:hypothetical protein
MSSETWKQAASEAMRKMIGDGPDLTTNQAAYYHAGFLQGAHWAISTQQRSLIDIYRKAQPRVASA